PGHLPALVQGLPRGDDHVAGRQALDSPSHPEASRHRGRPDLFQRAPSLPRGQRLLLLAVLRGRHSDGGRRGRVDDGQPRRRARHGHHAPQGDPLPALARPALQRVHRVPRLRGQRGRVQGHGHGAFRDAALRGQGLKLIRVGKDGAFELDMDYFSFHHSSDRTFNTKFVDLFGAPRDPRANFFTPVSGYPSYFGDRPENFDALARDNQHYADIAASIQKVTEEVLLTMARAAYEETELTRLCMAGGVALNSVANGRIIRETPFEELYVHPAAGDGGAAGGAALYGYHAILGKARGFVME